MGGQKVEKVVRDGVEVAWDKQMDDVPRRGNVPSYRTIWRHQDAAVLQKILMADLGLTPEQVAGPKNFQDAQEKFFEKYGKLQFPKVAAADTTPEHKAKIEKLKATRNYYTTQEKLTDEQIIEKMKIAKIPAEEINEVFGKEVVPVKKELAF